MTKRQKQVAGAVGGGLAVAGGAYLGRKKLARGAKALAGSRAGKWAAGAGKRVKGFFGKGKKVAKKGKK